jgi:hypothetical protein
MILSCGLRLAEQVQVEGTKKTGCGMGQGTEKNTDKQVLVLLRKALGRSAEFGTVGQRL